LLGTAALVLPSQPPPASASDIQQALNQARMEKALATRRLERFGRGETRLSEPVRREIEDFVMEDTWRAPTLVRLAFHSSGTYDKKSGTGGSQKGTIHYDRELNQADNKGLKNVVKALDKIKSNHDISRADLYTLAGVHAIEMMGGPVVPWRWGRVDATAPRETIKEGRLPQPDMGDTPKTAAHIRQVFERMGFNDQEMVALIGAHTAGECKKDNSGYEGPWTPTEVRFDNLYYTFLRKWKYKRDNRLTGRGGKMQFEVEGMNDDFMMLPADIVFRDDPKFRVYVDAYAEDEALWFRDFSAAFQKLTELGTRDLKEDSVVAPS